MSRVPSILLTGFMLAFAARAEPPRPAARLDYSRVGGAESCPDEEALRALVASRLGYDPFDAQASSTVSVSIEESSDGLRATVRIMSEGGRTAERSLSSRTADCRELAASTAFAIAMAIDPLMPTRAARKPAVPPVAPPSAPAQPELRAPRRTDVGIEAELLLGIGQAPEVGFGGALRVALLFESAAVSLEARADVPSSTSIGGGRVGSSLLSATAAGCYRWKYVQACALLSGGALRAFGDGFTGAAVRWLPFAAAGARAVVHVQLGSALYLQAHGDVLVPLVRSALLLSDVEAWRMPVVGGAIGAGLGYRLQ